MADSESPSFSVDAGDVGKAGGSTIGGLLGSALGPAGSFVGGLIGGVIGEAAGNAMGGKSGDTASFPGAQGAFANVGDVPEAMPGGGGPDVPSVIDFQATAPTTQANNGEVGPDTPSIIDQMSPTVQAPASPPAPPSITAAPEAPPSVTVAEPALAPAPVAAPEPITAASLAANRGPVRIVRGRGARRLLLYDAQTALPSALGA